MIEISKPEIEKLLKIFFSNPMHIPPIAGAVILFLGIIFFHNDTGLLGNFVIISMLVGFLPFVLVAYFNHEKIRVIEDHWPIFMRDMAESQKAGTNFPDALRITSKTDYGKLSREIKKMNDQLSWGIPLQEVLNRFSARMKGSDLIIRSVRIINEAYSSGGDIADTMESIATDVNIIKEYKRERTSRVMQHIIVIYIIYFVFIAIVISLSNTLLPILNMNIVAGGTSPSVGQGGITAGFSDPCIFCTDGNIMCISCSTFSVVSIIFSLGTGPISYYRALFLSMIIVQGIFTGLVAGQISSNSALAGVKHSLILTAIGFGVFMIALKLGVG